MKKMILCFCALLCVGFTNLFAQQRNDAAYNIIKNNISASKFVEGTVASADIEAIIAAGVSAPSASNAQPWKFVVVQTPDLIKDTVTDKNVPKGNIAIVVYADGDVKTNGNTTLDCGLAVQNIFLAAQALGYGSRIYSGTVATINKSLKSKFGIPASGNAIAVIRVGKITSRADAVASPSTRKGTGTLVTYK